MERQTIAARRLAMAVQRRGHDEAVVGNDESAVRSGFVQHVERSRTVRGNHVIADSKVGVACFTVILAGHMAPCTLMVVGDAQLRGAAMFAATCGCLALIVGGVATALKRDEPRSHDGTTAATTKVATTPTSASPPITWTRVSLVSCGISVSLPAGAHLTNPSVDEFLGRAGDTELGALCMPRSPKLSKDDALAVEEFSLAFTADNTVTATKHINVAGLPGFVAWSTGSDGTTFADVVAISASMVFCFSSAGPRRDLVDTVVDSIQVLPQQSGAAVATNPATAGVPLFHSDAPLYQSSAPLYGSPPPTYDAPSGGGVKDVYVHPYVKKDGTIVNGYMRKHPSK